MAEHFLDKAYDYKLSEIFPLGFEIKKDSFTDFDDSTVYTISICGKKSQDITIYEETSAPTLSDAYSDLSSCIYESISHCSNIDFLNAADLKLFIQLQLFNKAYFETIDPNIIAYTDIDCTVEYFISALSNAINSTTAACN